MQCVTLVTDRQFLYISLNNNTVLVSSSGLVTKYAQLKSTFVTILQSFAQIYLIQSYTRIFREAVKL
jgi:hypothetical protein